MEKMRNPQNDIDSSESLKTVSMHFLFRTNLKGSAFFSWFLMFCFKQNEASADDQDLL